MFAAAAAAALALAGEGSAQGTLEWTPCGKRAQCARLVAPLDHANPAGEQIELALLRLPATDPARRIGSLLVNPGGPGGSGVDFVRQSAPYFEHLRTRFDIVGFDPRGVGRSTAVRCLTDAELDETGALDPTPDTPSEHDALIEAARSYAARCAERAPALLPYVSTEQAARDLDLIRAVVGDEKLSFLGFSYGTELGATYASLFPDRVRALVLDGAVDPLVWANDPLELTRVQLHGFERSLTRFLAYCRRGKSDCVVRRNGDPESIVMRLLRRLDAKPLRAESGRRLTEGLALSGIVASLYSQQLWPLLGKALDGAWRRRDGRLLLLLADAYSGRREDGTYPNLSDANAAISCADWGVTATPDSVIEFADELGRTSPLFGPSAALSALTCSFWPVQPVSRYAGPFTAAGAPPILVVGTTGDPATPYVWAKSLARQLESGVLLTWRGDSHTAYGESECVAAAADRYLISLRAPRDGSVCRD